MYSPLEVKSNKYTNQRNKTKRSEEKQEKCHRNQSNVILRMNFKNLFIFWWTSGGQWVSSLPLLSPTVDYRHLFLLYNAKCFACESEARTLTRSHIRSTSFWTWFCKIGHRPEIRESRKEKIKIQDQRRAKKKLVSTIRHKQTIVPTDAAWAAPFSEHSEIVFAWFCRVARMREYFFFARLVVGLLHYDRLMICCLLAACLCWELECELWRAIISRYIFSVLFSISLSICDSLLRLVLVLVLFRFIFQFLL